MSYFHPKSPAAELERYGAAARAKVSKCNFALVRNYFESADLAFSAGEIEEGQRLYALARAELAK